MTKFSQRIHNYCAKKVRYYWAHTSEYRFTITPRDNKICVVISQDLAKSGILLNSEKLCESSTNFELFSAKKQDNTLLSSNLLVPIGSGKSYIQILAGIQSMKTAKLFLLLHDPKALVDYLGINSDLEVQGIFVHSDAAKKYLLENCKFIAEKIFVLGTGVPVLLQPPRENKTRNSKTIGTAGYWHKARDLKKTAQVLALLLHENRQINALWIGSLRLRQKFRVLWILKRKRIYKRVKFLEANSNNEFIEAIKMMDCALYLRKSSSQESSGLLIELAAQGIPTVRNDMGSNLELPTELFQKLPSSATLMEYANLVSRVLDSNDWSELSSKLIDYAKNHNIEKYSEEIQTVLNKII